MPTHPNAIGYIRDLGQSVEIPWFEMVCDLGAQGETSLSLENTDLLFQLLTNNASYIRPPAPAGVVSQPSAPTPERLELIGPFDNFKKIENDLSAGFTKRATVIFGTNGSGKSSLCEALQVLAIDEVPQRPLNNILDFPATTPSFSYKFDTDASIKNWSATEGYGSKSNALKYFNSRVATKNIRDSVQPGRVIEITPFKLEVFNLAKTHSITFRDALKGKSEQSAQQLDRSIEAFNGKFESFTGSVFSECENLSLQVLDAEVLLGQNYTSAQDLEDKLGKKSELEKATSTLGLQVLRGEVQAIKALLGHVLSIMTASESLIKVDPHFMRIDLVEKQNELRILAKSLIPSGKTLDGLLSIIRPANYFSNLKSPDNCECPLCRQNLGDIQLKLFQRYADLLTGELDEAIELLNSQVIQSEISLTAISNSTPDEWAKDSVLEPEIVDSIVTIAIEIKREFGVEGEISSKCIEATKGLREFFDQFSDVLKNKEKLIQDGGDNRTLLVAQLNVISNECSKLQYAKLISENLTDLSDLRELLKQQVFFSDILPTFPPLLKKVTDKAKEAHKELVVSDFEMRLNAEYLALAEKDMGAFGVKLKDVGGDGTVTVNHHVAGNKIDAVLSEGEQRIHALALFFAELETCGHQVIVFDDPVSSFDYNYIANYCNRIRDFLQVHQDKQVIILTHNWEFFVQIQTTLNQAQLNNSLSVMVLENCVSINEYSEKVDDLKASIESQLLEPIEPTRSEKETMAGNMRRLIEAVVNTHVFNKQRHQFKQKSQQVSAFNEFTKLVPLLTSEAQVLRDLYSKLSITEHDDPRNAYVNTDKAMFQTRYNSVVSVELAIESRK